MVYVNLGVFKILKIKNKSNFKIHNFRTSEVPFAKIILQNNKCNACFEKPFFFVLNKYYRDSYLKSILLYFYSLKFFNILKITYSLIALNEFHKTKLIERGKRRENRSHS